MIAAVADDFSPLAELGDWLVWLCDNPARAIREQVLSGLCRQVPGTALESVVVTGPARTRTYGRPVTGGPDGAAGHRLEVAHAAMAVPLALVVLSPVGVERMEAVLTWIATGLDRPARRDRVWFDIDAELDWAENQLTERVGQLGR